MGSKDNIFERYFATLASTSKTDRRLRTALRRLRKISSKKLGAKHCPSSNQKKHKRFAFGLQVHLQTRGLVPVEILGRLHKLFRTEQKIANEILDGLDELLYGLNADNMDIIMPHRAIRARCAEQLKVTAQLGGLHVPDPEITRETQELLEQFYEAHGKPNDVEKELLSLSGDVSEDVIDQWFAAKEFRLGPVISMERRTLDLKLQSPDFLASVLAQECRRRGGIKAYLLPSDVI